MLKYLTMESMHVYGIHWIQDLQYKFKNQSEVMLFLTKLGDPKFAFLLYFPLVYVLKPTTGIKVAWVGAISEMLNTVLKWFLHGHRPYWWVYESGIYARNHTPHLDQFRSTCETGPGSPSGHAMVTAAVLFIMVSSFLQSDFVRKSNMRTSIHVACWTLFSVFMAGVCISRCFIATHFPHQVITGVFSGVFVGKLSDDLINPSWNLRYYIASSVLIIILGQLLFIFLLMCGLDPLWSVAFALKHCRRSEWIHLDTSLFFALVKDSSTLAGLGLSLHVYGNPALSAEKSPSSLFGSVVAALICQMSEYFRPPSQPEWAFYILGYIKNAGVIYCVGAFYAWMKDVNHSGVETISTAQKLQ